MPAANRKKQSLIFVLGMALLLCAGIYSYIELSLDYLSIAIGLLGVLLLLFCLIYKDTSEHKSSKKLHWNKAGWFLMVASFSVVFLLSVNYLSHRMSYRWDVTEYKQHTLTPATIDFVNGMTGPVELTALYVGLPPKYLQDLLKEYARVSNGRISVNIIDPIEDIASAAKFGNVISSEQSKLVVASADERKDIDFSEAPLSEEQITNALTRVTREPRQVYLLSGHGEFSASNQGNQGLSQFVDLLSSNNIASKSLMLGAEQSIPEDCDVLIVAGPSTNLTNHEQALIKDYLQQGGDALFLIESRTSTDLEQVLPAGQSGKNPSLNSILNDWGVQIGNDVVVDLGSHIGGDEGSPATRNYGGHEAITDGLDYTFYVRPRSITALENRRASIRLAPIALSASKEQSWAEKNSSLIIHFDEGVDTPGPVPLSYVIWEEKSKDDESDTRIIVVTDADFLSNAYLNQYSNAAMGINVVNWLSELDYTVFLDQKNIKVERMDLTSKQQRMVTSILFLMPLLIGILGVFVRLRS